MKQKNFPENFQTSFLDSVKSYITEIEAYDVNATIESIGSISRNFWVFGMQAVSSS